MQLSLRDRRKITDEVADLLSSHLQTNTVKDNVSALILDFVKKNKIDVDVPELSKNIQWRVEVYLGN